MQSLDHVARFIKPLLVFGPLHLEFYPNVICDFSMESREAFERHGDVHGVFVDALLRHLTKPIRVNFMLSYAQEDVKKSGVQVGFFIDLL